MYANSHFERNALSLWKNPKPLYTHIYISNLQSTLVPDSAGWQTSKYHPHCSTWCTGFSKIPLLASECYDLRPFLSLDVPELISWLYLRPPSAALLCSSSPAPPDSSFLSAAQTSLPAGIPAVIAHLQTGKYCQPLASSAKKTLLISPRSTGAGQPGVRTDIDAEGNSHPKSQWQKENVARVSMTGEHSLRTEMEESRGRRDIKGERMGKSEWADGQTMRSRTEFAPSDRTELLLTAWSPLRAEKQSLAMLPLCLHVKKTARFCQRTVVMCVKISLQNSLGNCYSSCESDRSYYHKLKKDQDNTQWVNLSILI